MSFYKRLIKVIPLIVIIAFLFVGLQFENWGYASLILILLPLHYVIFSMKSIHSSYPFLMICIHLGFGFAFDAWRISWLAYLTIPVFYTLFPPNLKTLKDLRKVEKFGRTNFFEKDDDNIIDQ